MSLGGTKLIFTAILWNLNLAAGAPPESFHHHSAEITLPSHALPYSCEFNLLRWGNESWGFCVLWCCHCGWFKREFEVPCMTLTPLTPFPTLTPHLLLAPHHSCEKCPQCGQTWWFASLLSQSFSKRKLQNVWMIHLWANRELATVLWDESKLVCHWNKLKPFPVDHYDFELHERHQTPMDATSINANIPVWRMGATQGDLLTSFPALRARSLWTSSAFAWFHLLFSKDVHEDSPFSEQYGDCSLYCTLLWGLSHLVWKTAHKGSRWWNIHSFPAKEFSLSHCIGILLPVLLIFYQLVFSTISWNVTLCPFLLFYSFMPSFFQQMFMEWLHKPNTVLGTMDSKVR